MKRYHTVTASLGLALVLAACSSLPAFLGGTDSKVQSLIAKWHQDISAFEQLWQDTLAKANGAAADAGTLLRTSCAVGSVFNGVFQDAAPQLGASAADLANEQTGVAVLNTICSKPVTDVASAAAAAIGATKAIKDATSNSAPQLVAASKPTGA